MSFSFENLKTSQKVLALSATLNVLMVLLSGYGISLLYSNQSSLQNMEATVEHHIISGMTFETDILSIFADLNGLVSTASSETDEKKIAALASSNLAKITDSANDFEDYKESVRNSGLSEEEISKLDQSYRAFVKSAKGIIDMAESDATTALMWMTGTRQKYEALALQVRKVTEHLKVQKKETIKNLFANMEDGRVIFVVTTCIIFGFGLFLSRAIGSKISRPIIQMANAIQRLSQKDYNTVIPALGQLDEIGAMARSVEGFKEALAQADRLAAEQAQEQSRKQKRTEAMDALMRDFDADISNVIATLSSSARTWNVMRT